MIARSNIAEQAGVTAVHVALSVYDGVLQWVEVYADAAQPPPEPKPGP